MYRLLSAAANQLVLRQTVDDLYLLMYIPVMLTNEKPLEWIGSSHKDLMALPADVRRFFGFALSLAQAGDQHDAASPHPKKTWTSFTHGSE